MKKIIMGIVALALSGGAWWFSNLIWFKPNNIDHFFERVFIEFAMQNPELLSSIRIAEQFGIKAHNSKLSDASPENDAAMLAKTAKDLAILKQYNPSTLSAAQQLSYQILDYYLSNTIAGTPWIYHDYPLNQMAGIQSELPDFMANTHYVGDYRDAKDYVARLSKFDDKFAQVLSGLRLRESQQIVPPLFVIEKVLNEMTQFIQPAPKQHLLYTNLQTRLDTLADIKTEDKADILARTEEAIQQSVYPAYDSLITYFTQLQSKANNDDGVWKMPKGDAYYAYALQQHTTTDLSPDSVHRLGLSEVERISQEMRSILTQLGYAKSESVGSCLQKMTNDPRFQYPETEAGKEQCLKDYQHIIDEIDSSLQKNGIFGIKPEMGVKVMRVPEFKQATAPGAYYNPPAMDGSRPGIFYANLRTLKDIPKWSMRTLAYHEAIPGHHFQIGIAQTLDSLPTFRTLVPFTAYTEGWALYAEQLAWELGFQKDPYSNLGRLQAELFRAVRLVVDTGIHSKCWTREQAINYMEQTTGMGHTDVVSEIERYIVNPGQACAYKIGMMKILQLREKAKTALGNRFNLREFHHVMLKNGALPLNLLEKIVDEYLAKAAQS
jgi:uncharacterized protein (DUF885 family)